MGGSEVTRVNRRVLMVGTLATAAASVASPALANMTLPQPLVWGQSVLPKGQAVWRVVLDILDTPWTAQYEARELGFAVNKTIPMRFTDQVTGTSARIEPWGAIFTRQGTVQQRETISKSPGEYLRIGLVSVAEGKNAGGDVLKHTSPAFTVPSGEHRIGIYRVQPQRGTSVTLPHSDLPKLVIVEQGSVSVTGKKGRVDVATTVSNGTQYGITSSEGAHTLTATSDRAMALVVMVGHPGV